MVCVDVAPCWMPQGLPTAKSSLPAWSLDFPHPDCRFPHPDRRFPPPTYVSSPHGFGLPHSFSFVHGASHPKGRKVTTEGSPSGEKQSASFEMPLLSFRDPTRLPVRRRKPRLSSFLIRAFSGRPLFSAGTALSAETIRVGAKNHDARTLVRGFFASLPSSFSLPPRISRDSNFRVSTFSPSLSSLFSLSSRPTSTRNVLPRPASRLFVSRMQSMQREETSGLLPFLF